jgi:dTDP-4-amino-4,6-dideoxygalactose transaminase
VSQTSTKTKVKVPLLDLSMQNGPLLEAIRRAMDEVIASNYFIMGGQVTAFEKQVAEYLGVKHAVGVSSGTDALLAALMAIGIGPGDEVITTPFTFFATVGSIARLDARPVFADIEPDTFNIDPALIEKAVTKKTKAILPVHLFGQSADMGPIMEIANRYDLKVIEDAAQAIGAKYKGRKVGGIGHLGCFSFFPSKNLGCFGDGGLITTNDGDLAEMCRLMRAHGSKPKYYHKYVGGNFRLDTLQAAILSVKLPHLEKWHEGRRRNAAWYDKALADLPIVLPVVRPDNDSIYNQYTIRVPDGRRDALRQHLTSAGVGTEIYYPVPMHLQECFACLGYKTGDMPASEAAAGEVLSIPIYPELKQEQMQHVAHIIKDFYR